MSRKGAGMREWVHVIRSQSHLLAHRAPNPNQTLVHQTPSIHISNPNLLYIKSQSHIFVIKLNLIQSKVCNVWHAVHPMCCPTLWWQELFTLRTISVHAHALKSHVISGTVVYSASCRGFQRTAPRIGGGEQLTVLAVEVQADCWGTLLPNPSSDAVRCVVCWF